MIATRLSGEPGNLGEEIVIALKRYGSVPVEFLSRLTGRDPLTIEKYLTALEQKRVVKREDQNVKLDVQEDQNA